MCTMYENMDTLHYVYMQVFRQVNMAAIQYACKHLTIPPSSRLEHGDRYFTTQTIDHAVKQITAKMFFDLRVITLL